MDSTVSISKGVFVFKNGATAGKQKKKSKSRKNKQATTSLLEPHITSSAWYEAYRLLWNKLHNKIEQLQQQSYEKIYNDLLKFIRTNSAQDEETIGTAALLTGINQTDHIEHFSKLADQITNQLNCITVTLQARSCPTVKAAIENLVSGVLSEGNEDEIKLKRYQLNMWSLLNWYNSEFENTKDKPSVIVMIPDFEAFTADVIQKLVLILHGYRSQIPFIFILGVATSTKAIHDVLPYNCTSKISVEVFQSDPSPVCLNRIIDEVLLTPDCPFHLSGRTFRLLTDIFLFYDFSVHGFIQGFQYCMMEHFYQGNIFSLCSNDIDYHETVKSFTTNDLEDIRHLHSFRPFVESNPPEKVIKLLTNDEYLRSILPGLTQDLKFFWYNFHCALEILHQLCQNLPKTPFGKHLREMYSFCISTDIVDSLEFKEITQLLTFFTKTELLEKLFIILSVAEKYSHGQYSGYSKELKQTLELSIEEINAASMEVPVSENVKDTSFALESKMNRFELKEKLLQAAKQPKLVSPYTKAVTEVIDEIKRFLGSHLRPISKAPPLIELFVFTDSLAAKRHIMGVPRASIHTALNNPAHYLQCKCCELDHDASLLPSMPDLSIVYKLHLECGKMINLFDWLQAFKMVVDDRDMDDNEENDDRTVDPKIQARFTRAVAELQFLGFIKTSKKKTDHVQRLTW